MASGCLGLISFPREPGRVSLERIEALYPRLIPALRDHPGHRLRPRPLRARRARWRSAPAAPTTSTTTGSRARTRWRPFGPQRRRPPAAHRRLPPLRRPDGQQHLLAASSARSPPSRSWSARTAAWAGPRASPSSCTRPSSSGRRRRSSAPNGSTGSSAAGSPGSGTTAYASEVDSPGASTRSSDLRRQLAHPRRRTRAAARAAARDAAARGRAGRACPSGSGPRAAARAAPPPAPRRSGSRCPAPRLGPQPQTGSSARSRSGRQVLHPVEEVGVAGEVDAAGCRRAGSRPPATLARRRGAGRRRGRPRRR